MSKQLRTHLLVLLEQHSRTGSNHYKTDVQLAEATGAPVEEIRRQLDILEEQRLTTSANTHGGHNARISPAGSLAVEALEESLQPEERKSIGFSADE